MNNEMLKGFLYSRLGKRDAINCDKFIEEMAEYFDVNEITEKDVREAVGDLIKEEYVLYGEIDHHIVATTPNSLSKQNQEEN